MSRTGESGPGRERYGAVAVGLHWLIAALLIGNIAIAWYFNTLTGLPKIAPTQLHKSIGISVLILSVVRLAWRLAKPPPSLPSSLEPWERFGAGCVYVLFYVVMLAMPLSGWAMSSASRLIQIYPITLFGLVHWPAIAPLASLPPGPMHQAHQAFMTAHQLLAKLAYGLIVLHIAAALRHQFVKRDAVVARMIPMMRRQGT